MSPQAAAEETARIQRAATRLDRALTVVACGALAFSTVNVALLAIDHGVPAWIAWMLEPLVGIALWAVLSSDAVLSRYGMRAGAAAWLLRSFTGGATLVLNVWGSVFATGAGGRLVWDPDPAGILLHAIAPVLLILLAEAAPRYRARFARITARLRQDASRTSPQDTPDGSAAAAPPGGPTTASAVPGAAAGAPLQPAADRVPQRDSRAETEARARAVLEAEPSISGAELARRLGVQPRTGQRILNRLRVGAE